MEPADGRDVNEWNPLSIEKLCNSRFSECRVEGGGGPWQGAGGSIRMEFRNSGRRPSTAPAGTLLRPESLDG